MKKAFEQSLTLNSFEKRMANFMREEPSSLPQVPLALSSWLAPVLQPLKWRRLITLTGQLVFLTR